MTKSYTVSDGKLVLTMTPDEGGWYCVTSPMQPGMVTQARSVPEAFEMARDAIKTLRAARKQLYGGKRLLQAT
ncbi:MAG: type II toxin-antitoxin system HicB family antitoxin [Planctomycetes bacterium]|nr:type II toxin-antitoxin system HicB family antitoxin [Planctomycetota bacterium]